ncbi:acetate kinase [Piedraia hortae CBS 480.64]|uniref:Probable acetate kinase n=1 Tax=Piedraia hortae CBS 480.64 TaxID=1314780 RepID=A0A6A7C513_9PEZI|nr:acetate kinase [Piedraia hortae CBS 480.64]
MATQQTLLAINAGSSSVKVSVFGYSRGDEDPKPLADIEISGLTAPPARLTYSRGNKHVDGQEVNHVRSQSDAWAAILDQLMADDGLPLQKVDDIVFACHRVVHGGGNDRPVRIVGTTLRQLEALSELAPLHNAGALEIVKEVQAKCPNTANVACFDNAFHSTMPLETRTYAIDPAVAKRNELRRYGFHGLSYSFITRAVARYLSKSHAEVNLIALHLGSGASACCIRQGMSMDTSMGLTPLSGLPGATRSGSVDPSLIFHFTNNAGNLAPGSTKEMHITQAEQILNKESGWKVLTGTTDFGSISTRAEKGDEKCKLAFDLMVDRICGFVGAYFVKLEGKVDALVFAGGIGEHGASLRKAVVQKVACLGFGIDNESPELKAVVTELGPKTLICKTDEQAEMARECMRDAERLLGD